MKIGAGRRAPDLAELRRVAARRRAVGDKVRRLIPGVIVGSTTLVGSGALAAWVSGQPGVASTSGGAVAGKAPTAATTPPTTDALQTLQQALRSDENTLQSLEAAVPNVAAVASPAAPPAGSAATVPTVAPIPRIAIPVIPQVASTPAPAVNATTGASHALP